MYFQPGEPDVVRIHEARCPHCSRALDAVAVTEGHTRMPRDGDISICLGCGEPAAFVVDAPGARVTMRACNEVERAEVERDHAEALARVRAFVNRRRPYPGCIG